MFREKEELHTPRGIVRLVPHQLTSVLRIRDGRVENKKLVGSRAILKIRDAIVEIVRCRNGWRENGKGESQSERGENFCKHLLCGGKGNDWSVGFQRTNVEVMKEKKCGWTWPLTYLMIDIYARWDVVPYLDHSY